MASREEVLVSISPEMRLTKDFFKRVHGYEISYPGFADEAISALEAAGCSKARQYYCDWLSEFQAGRDAELDKAARWYRLECERQWERKQKEGGVKRAVREEMELLEKKRQLLKQKSQMLTGN